MSEMGDSTTVPSLLDFASKEAFGCDDYEPIDEDVTTFLVTPEDALHTVLEKAKLIGDRILDGKSVAVALGELKDKRKEDFDVKSLTLKERHIWQQWKRGRGALPEMEWQFQKEISDEDESNEQISTGYSQGAKRKVVDGDASEMPTRKQAKNDSKNVLKITSFQQEALADMYRMPSDIKTKVEALDVRHFQVLFPQLRPLLNALTKIVQSRHTYKCSMATEEQKVLESHCTSKAIFMIEKQVKWIMEEANSTVDAIQEQVTLMRGRLAALEGEAEEEEVDEVSLVDEDNDEEEVIMAIEPYSSNAEENVQVVADETVQVAKTLDKPAPVSQATQHPTRVPHHEVMEYQESPRAHTDEEEHAGTKQRYDERVQVETHSSNGSEKSVTVSKYPELSEEERETIKEQIQEEESRYVETYAYPEEQQYYEEMKRGNLSDGTVDSNDEASVERRYPGYTDAQSESGQAYEADVSQHNDQDEQHDKTRHASPIDADAEEVYMEERNTSKRDVRIEPSPWKIQAAHSEPKQMVKTVADKEAVDDQEGLQFYNQSRSFFTAFGM